MEDSRKESEVMFKYLLNLVRKMKIVEGYIDLFIYIVRFWLDSECFYKVEMLIFIINI